jgi:hypothetical protein
LTGPLKALLRQSRDGGDAGIFAKWNFLGVTRMKKIMLVAAAAGLLSVAACKNTPTDNAADAASDNLEMIADNLEAQAENTSNEAVAADLMNASENAEDASDAIENAAEHNGM